MRDTRWKHYGSFMTRKGAGEARARNLFLRWGCAPPAIQTFLKEPSMNTFRKTLFAAALSALAGAALAAPPAAAPATSGAQAKTTLAKHKRRARAQHFARVCGRHCRLPARGRMHSVH
jgi:hypothetical protein